MQQQRPKRMVMGVGPGPGINAAMPGCDGVCSRCKHGVPKVIGGIVSATRFLCTAGEVNLRADAPTNVLGVDESGPGAEVTGTDHLHDRPAGVRAINASRFSGESSPFGFAADRRERDMNSGRNERRAIVNWQNENAKDTRLLQLGSLSPLDSLPVTADGDLVGLAEMHNEHLVRAADRVRQLAADREKLADFDAWQEADCTDIGSAVCHVKRESWDTVLYLRRVLQEREIVLQQVKARLRERHERLYAAHVETVAAAEKRLTKERRALEKASPSTAGSHFADLMAEDEQVVAAAEASAAVKQGFEAAATALRAIPEDLREIKRRQRELFEVMVA